jgi:7-cyano-7-deazaguanine synthase
VNFQVINMPSQETIGVLVSGGLDSCVLVARLLDEGRPVQPFYVQSDLCWQREERLAVEKFLAALRSPGLRDLVVLDMPMADLYQDHWSVTGSDFPAAGTADEEVYLHGRNALLALKAALWCQLNGIPVLALAALASNPFADASDSFFRNFESAINLPGTPAVQLVAPLAGMKKREVMRLGRGFPLHLTFSCIAPVRGLHCGECNKCEERQVAFREAGVHDSSRYANGVYVSV